MMRFVILATALLMTACQPLPAKGTAGGEGDYAGQTPVPSAAGSTDAAACAAQGGKMVPQGRMQTVRCLIAYADAGKRCTDGDQCQGDCRIDDVAAASKAGQSVSGQCQANSSRFGCYTTVENGQAEATICVD